MAVQTIPYSIYAKDADYGERMSKSRMQLRGFNWASSVVLNGASREENETRFFPILVMRVNFTGPNWSLEPLHDTPEKNLGVLYKYDTCQMTRDTAHINSSNKLLYAPHDFENFIPSDALYLLLYPVNNTYFLPIAIYLP